MRNTVGVMAWTRNPGRLVDLGRALDVAPKIIAFRGLKSRWLTPLRYVLSTVVTVGWLLRTQPRVVIVSSPPPFAALLVAVYARLFDRDFVLDAHPGSFGHRMLLWRAFVPLHRALVRQARATMVTEPLLGDIVARWGGVPLVFHEAPPLIEMVRPHSEMRHRPHVVFTTIFDSDEPLDVIAEAASQLRECDVAITGDQSRLPLDLRRTLLREHHVRLTGWLDQSEYLALVSNADVVVALTSDPYSVMRSAFEAAYLGRATVLSDTKTLQTYFAPSVFVDNTSSAVVNGVRSLVMHYEPWIERLAMRQDTLMRRWATQQTSLNIVMFGST